jgi:hypothetical protein
MIAKATAAPARPLLACTLFVAAALSACDRPRAIGDATQIVVAAPTDFWLALEDDIKDALEPRTFTVRDERVFDVGHIQPGDEGWASLRAMRQVLVIGNAEQPAVEEVLRRHRGDAPSPPAMFQVRNVWAQNQVVTLLLLPPGAQPEAALPLLPELGATYLRQFEEYARSRMFVTGANAELADSLRREAGFELTLPRVYRVERPRPELIVFRNDQPDPSRLIRNVTVAARPAEQVRLSADYAADWRETTAAQLTEPPQLTEALPQMHSMEVAGHPAVQINGIWSNPPGEWPAAGPFITRLVECPDQVFMLDAWLYAPGVPKYEYMYQLNTILNSFRCAAG